MNCCGQEFMKRLTNWRRCHQTTQKKENEMSAAKLVARPYVPDPPERPVRSFMSLAQAILEQKPPDWPELRSGARGLDISGCRFGGLRDLGTSSDVAGGYLAKSSQPATFFDAMIAAAVVGRAGAKTDRPGGERAPRPH